MRRCAAPAASLPGSPVGDAEGSSSTGSSAVCARSHPGGARQVRRDVLRRRLGRGCRQGGQHGSRQRGRRGIGG
eukprot:14809740-Alexandrium_andersonii.AAC.1